MSSYKIRIWIVDNFYLLFILLTGIVYMIFRFSGMHTVLYLLLLFVFFSLKHSKSLYLTDILVVCFVLYSLFSYLFNADYPLELYIRSARDQVIPIAFYFIARNKEYCNNRMLEKMIYPLGATYLIGIFLFFSPPGWYVSFKISDETVIFSSAGLFENLRFSSFWSHSYTVGYSALFVIIYILNKRVLYDIQHKYYSFVLLLAFVAIIFAQQRVSIAFLGIYLIGLYCIGVKRGKINFSKSVLIIFSLSSIIGVITYIILSYMDVEYLNYLYSRSVDMEDSLVDERVGMFSEYINGISFWGSGLGKYSHNALIYGMPSIADCEYIRLPNELGLFGAFLFLGIIMSSYLRLFRNKKYYSYEMICISFYLVSMIGATPLEMVVQQPFMLWYCIGRSQLKCYYDKC